MDLRSLISKLEEIEKSTTLSEAAPTDFVPTHFHKNNLGYRAPVMLHSDGKFYHKTKNNQYGTPGFGQEMIATWNGNTENRSAINPASIDGEFVDGKPVDYPEGVTWKTFKKDTATTDTAPAADQSAPSSDSGQAATPAPSKEDDELAKDIETATKLLDKAEGKASAPAGQGGQPSAAPKNQPAMSFAGVNVKESISSQLLESFGYIQEALTDLSAEEQKQLTDVMSKLGPMTTGRPDVQTLVDRYMALQKGGTPAKEPEKTDTAEPGTEDPLLGPEELKTAVARFKELLDKSLMRDKEGQGPQPAPKPRPKKKPVSGPYLGAGNSPGNVTIGGSMLGPAHTGQWNGQPIDVPAGWGG